MIKVLDVAYARFQAPDLDLMEQFLGDFGLTTSEKTENALYLINLLMRKLIFRKLRVKVKK